tara:strand:- start:5611 stop:6177 length:567 start_codon:yes stop_codon:yes gene_type:complete
MNKEYKTHWLQNPNKNYFGHQDLPNGKPVTLTILSAKWEAVTNPRTNQSDDKRVVRFKEDNKWLKPFIVNETNAAAILKSTEAPYMEDCEGLKIQLYVAQIKVGGETVDCIRVAHLKQDELIVKTITAKQRDELQELIGKAEKDEDKVLELVKKVCIAYNVVALIDLNEKQYQLAKKRLTAIIKENNA